MAARTEPAGLPLPYALVKLYDLEGLPPALRVLSVPLSFD